MSAPPVREVLLGLLVDRPDHGYSLKRRLSPGVRAERLINDGVLYPLLGRMQDEGLLSSRLERHGGRTRRRFSATAAGRRAFRAWLRSDADENYGPTYELYVAHPLVKLLFGEQLEEEQRRLKLERHLDGVRERLATLERLRSMSDPRAASSANVAWLELEIAVERQRLGGLEGLLDETDEPIGVTR